MGIATTTQSAAVRELSDGNSQGTRLGRASTDKIGFYGLATCIAKPTPIGSNTLSTAVSSTGAFGFGDATTASTVIAVINQLVNLGLIG